MSENAFCTIRVYGILIQDERVLLSREKINGSFYTKFPGGGLEYGEGIIDCLKREMQEEAGVAVEDPQFFHINENFVPSAFHEKLQVISIYYLIRCNESGKITTGTADKSTLEDEQVLYWKALKDIKISDVDLPIDQQVVNKLLKEYSY